MADMARVEELLRKYPSLFVSLPAAGIEKELILIDKLQDEDFEDINLKESRTQNVVSYAHFIKGEKAKAYKINNDVLQLHSCNVIALSNKAWFLYEDNKFSEAEQVCQLIDRAGNVELMVAKGELAFAYSKFGLKTYDLAVKEYEELLVQWKKSGAPEMYLCMWSFGLFLLLYRKRKDSKTFTESDSLSERRRLQILRSVTAFQPRDETTKLYQAKCYANICRIRYDQVCKLIGNERRVQLRQEPLQAMEKAYELGYNDVYTLDLIGKYMRFYKEKVPTSISCLKRSIELRETSKGYQRLALAQKRELENNEFQKQPRRKQEPNARIVILMKCPRRPATSLRQYKDSPQMEEILKNLDKAVELDSKNMEAYYDFGLTYRQIDEHEKALEKFEHILKFKEGPRTLLIIANAYEQSGFCIADMMDTDKVTFAEQREFENKMISAFKKSVALSCSLVKMVPSLGKIWKTTPTLRHLLTGTIRTTQEVKELLFLDERLKSQSSLDILQTLSSVDGQSGDTDRSIREIINQLVAAEKYDDAGLAMEMITCLPDGYEALNDITYIDGYIRGGLEAYMSGEVLLGRLRIVNALTFRKTKSLMREGEMTYEILDEDIANLQGTEVILIYQHDSLKDVADSVLSVFKEVGVKIQAYPPSKQIVCGDDSSVLRNYIVLVDGSISVYKDGASLQEAMENLAINNFDTNVDLIFEDLDRRTYGNLLVVKLQSDTLIPEILRDLFTVTFRAEKNRQPGCLDEEDLEFVASALKSMANF